MWDGVREHLTRSDVEAWDLAGFGSPRPEGFHCSKEKYVSWLIERLQAIGEPGDLVGHDWGCLLTARVASVRPDLIRTWAGSNGPVSAEHVWHPLAKLGQDSVAGDRWAKEYDPCAFAKDEQTAGRVDETMRDSILKRHPLSEAGQQPLDAYPEAGRGRRRPWVHPGRRWSHAAQASTRSWTPTRSASSMTSQRPTWASARAGADAAGVPGVSGQGTGNPGGIDLHTGDPRW
ncbi:alpha/beta hydrolase [Streptomyces sp. NPDC007851]|uniref:alpha/beta hydrolase n=1 Tax=Streptomyces sp. NPDC007851 TaxID=3155008 RepID=UPI0033F8B6A7